MYTNMYVVSDEITKEGILIDCGGAVPSITEYVNKMNIKLKYLILTHCHADHTASIKEIKKEFPRIQVVINDDDKDGLNDPIINKSELLDINEFYITPEIIVRDGDIIKFGNEKAEIIHTPGHTAGSMCILVGDALYSGDTLFRGTRGRTDLETGSEREIMWSIKEKLMKLSNDIIVYPGHGLATKISEERKFYLE